MGVPPAARPGPCPVTQIHAKRPSKAGSAAKKNALAQDHLLLAQRTEKRVETPDEIKAAQGAPRRAGRRRARNPNCPQPRRPP